MKISKYNTLLGIAFDGAQMSVACLRKAGQRLEVRRQFQTTLTLDPLTSDPELVGHEVRNHLGEAGINEKRCVLCVPLKWALIARVEIPALMTGADRDGYIAVQSEREFPFAPDELMTSVSMFEAPGGGEHATIAAFPASHVMAFQKIMKAAKLRPQSITLGITAVVDPAAAGPAVILHATGQGVDMLIAAGGGIVALRSLEDHSNVEHPAHGLDVAAIARQIRITLGQLPVELRESVHTLQVFGSGERAEQILEDLPALTAPLGLEVSKGALPCREWLSRPGSDRAGGIAAVAACAERLLGLPPAFEFLPPRSSWLKQTANRFSARAALYLASAAVLLITGCVAALVLQHRRLARLEAEWEAISPRVAQAEAIQEKVRNFRPWASDEAQSLDIMKQLTEAFPEAGDVWAKSISMKEGLSKITCAGDARNNDAVLRMSEKLKDSPGVSKLTSQMQGAGPTHFSLSYTLDGAR